ncbi:MAG: hypothetical protein MJ096_06025, partial [Clostridia bacterium]|nr:hypothetical protein [Clostridia bacterium]
MKLELINGKFEITRNGETVVRNVRTYKMYFDGEREVAALPEGEWVQSGNRFLCDNYTVEYNDIADNAITVKATYKNTLGITVGHSPFVVLEGKPGFKADVCLFTEPDAAPEAS